MWIVIPETSANFNELFEMIFSPRVTASKQKMQKIVMAIVEFSVDNTVCGPPRKKKRPNDSVIQ